MTRKHSARGLLAGSARTDLRETAQRCAACARSSTRPSRHLDRRCERCKASTKKYACGRVPVISTTTLRRHGVTRHEAYRDAKRDAGVNVQADSRVSSRRCRLAGLSAHDARAAKVEDDHRNANALQTNVTCGSSQPLARRNAAQLAALESWAIDAGALPSMQCIRARPEPHRRRAGHAATECEAVRRVTHPANEVTCLPARDTSARGETAPTGARHIARQEGSGSRGATHWHDKKTPPELRHPQTKRARLSARPLGKTSDRNAAGHSSSLSSCSAYASGASRFSMSSCRLVGRTTTIQPSP